MPLRSAVVAGHAERRRVLGSFLVMLAVPFFTQCTLVPQGPSHVAQGKYYSSAHPEYDAFFLSLYELQVRMGRAPIEHREIQTTLAQSLGLSSELGRELLLTRLHERATALQGAGTRLLLLVHSDEGDPVPLGEPARASTARFLVDGKPDDAEVQRFTRAIEKASNALLTFRRALVENKATLEKLSIRVIELEARVDATFGPEGIAKAAEVDQNLEDASKIITLMRARASELSEDSGALLSGLVSTTNTDDGRLASRSQKRSPQPGEDDEDESSEPESPPEKQKPAKPRPAPKRRRTPPPEAAPPTEFEP